MLSRVTAKNVGDVFLRHTVHKLGILWVHLRLCYCSSSARRRCGIVSKTQ